MKEFTSEEIDMMRERLAESEMEMLGMDDHALFSVLMEGCDGWEKADDDEVVQKYLEVYGEFE